MSMMFPSIIILFFISSVILIVSFLISKKMIMDREKSSPFECGFDPKKSARIPFSLQFFLIALIFLIFDVEITLILPIIIMKNLFNSLSWWMIFSFFILILIMGLYHEWNQGALNWPK
uniref:NADH-ubiquinone oxidoreductase chain 3 n=1 Tax=Octostigma sinensis TaxID=211997 RepID=U3KTM6_9HEXA|nr:NADH dehydrogenase subunit 3 [Octostigma sinensis]AEV44840.1 NADH dehydrogenase subunit 3 [Octostigma sinensis]